MDYFELGYFGLFAIAFLAATIIPLTSEGVLFLFLMNGYDPLICLFVASFGNILGGLTNYLLGYLVPTNKLLERFKKSKNYFLIHQKATKHGYWLAVFGWVPIIGDPLLLLLGALRVSFLPFILLMSIGKVLRYYIIIFLMQ
jgi:membrane protein YqaA with SNARE-associated domain